MNLKYILVAVVMFCGCGAPIDVSGPERADGRTTVMTAAIPPAADEPPASVRAWYVNEDGSCVQLAIGINGVKRNNIKAATLPFDTIYGVGIRGGSTPSRVSHYCDERGITAFNVTGELTKDYIEYAVDTGRGVAIGADWKHFQTVMHRDKARGFWYVCDNRWPEKIIAYNDDSFWKLHVSMGYRWCVVLDGPATPPVPRYLAR